MARQRVRITQISNPYRFRVYQTSGGNSNNATNSKFGFNTVEYDPASGWNAANNRYVAPVAGSYRLSARFSVATSSNVSFGMIYKNGVEVRRGTLGRANNEYQGSVVTDVIDLAAGDYVEFWYYVVGTLAFEVNGARDLFFSGSLENAS